MSKMYMWNKTQFPCFWSFSCSISVLVFSLQHPASHWKSGVGNQSRGVHLRSPLSLHWYCANLPLHPSNQWSCYWISHGLSTPCFYGIRGCSFDHKAICTQMKDPISLYRMLFFYMNNTSTLIYSCTGAVDLVFHFPHLTLWGEELLSCLFHSLINILVAHTCFMLSL